MLLEEGEERLEQHHVRLIASRSCAPHVLSRFELGSPGFCTVAWTIFPPCVVQGRVAISHSPSSSLKRSPSWSCMGRVGVGVADSGVGKLSCFADFFADRLAIWAACFTPDPPHKHEEATERR